MLDLADTLYRGADAATDVLADYYCLPISKDTSKDILTERGILKLFIRVAKLIKTSTKPYIQQQVSTAVRDLLSADLTVLNDDQLHKVIARAAKMLPVALSLVKLIDPVLTPEMRKIVEATRKAAQSIHDLNIQTSLSLLDRRIVDHIKNSQAFFVSAKSTGINHAWSTVARGTVAEGAELGLGRSAIAEMLEARLGSAAVLGQYASYYEVLAATFVNRARIFALGSAFKDAGINRYQFEAVMDERTTEQCRCLHGQTFSVGSMMRRFDDIERAEDPEAVKDLTPWIRQRMLHDGRVELFTKTSDGTETRVAIADRVSVGRRDTRGTYTSMLSPNRMEAHGIPIPPIHGRCRSTIIPVG
jgi:SPP1 gp7 family putative phage head morphogenesis protein